MHGRGETTPTPADAPTLELDDEFWKEAELIMPGDLGKVSVHLRLEPDVLDWFKAQGKGHITRMQSVLKAYYLAQRNKAK